MQIAELQDEIKTLRAKEATYEFQLQQLRNASLLFESRADARQELDDLVGEVREVKEAVRRLEGVVRRIHELE
jgi:hypothetical protein